MLQCLGSSGLQVLSQRVSKQTLLVLKPFLRANKGFFNDIGRCASLWEVTQGMAQSGCGS